MSWLALAGVAAAVAVAAALVVWRERVRETARASVAFLYDVRGEIQKVTWPDKQQLRNATLVILAFVGIVALLIGALDIVLQWLVVTLPGRLS
ncbi:MAG: preprotein translocase subunit SecE [Gemmatimonadetes bacterium]|nr:preprotein translocase subunit SecE [Gemmatimonadota bacterium]